MQWSSGWREGDQGVRVGSSGEVHTDIQGTYMVNGHTILVLKSSSIMFMIVPFDSRIKSKFSSKIVNTINREDDDFFTVKIAEIQNNNLFARLLHFLANAFYFSANMLLIQLPS